MNKLHLFILLLVFLLFLPIAEGFTNIQTQSPLIGEYEYLAPIPDSNTWTQDTLDKFVDKYNSVNEVPASQMLKSDTFVANGGFKIALEKEAIYFNDNGKWPINKYVIDYLTTHKPSNFGQPIKGKEGKEYSLETISEMMPNRIIYQTFIAPTEMQMTQLPMSYQIFKGMVKPPASNDAIPTS